MEVLMDSKDKVYSGCSQEDFENSYQSVLEAIMKRVCLPDDVLGFLSIGNYGHLNFGSNYCYGLCVTSNLKDAITSILSRADSFAIRVNEQNELELRVRDYYGHESFGVDESYTAVLYPLSANLFNLKELKELDYYDTDYELLIDLYHRLNAKHGITLTKDKAVA